MATLNTTNLKHASSGSNNIVLASDGSVTIPTLTATSLTTSSSFGKLRQYKILSKTNHSSITGTTPTLIPDFSITITPTASDSIMVVKANMMCSINTHVILFRIYNGTTQVIQPATFDSHDDGTGAWYGSGDRMTNQHITTFETSGNTNARTYNVYWNVTGGTGWMNRYQGSNTYNSTSTLEVMEVAP
jgi:hypothetical protein